MGMERPQLPPQQQQQDVKMGHEQKIMLEYTQHSFGTAPCHQAPPPMMLPLPSHPLLGGDIPLALPSHPLLSPSVSQGERFGMFS